MKAKALLLAILGGALLWTIAAAAAPGQKEEVMKAGKEGEITLTQPTKVADITLPPDTYVVQHRTSGNEHFVRFMQIKKLHDLNLVPETTGWYTYTEKNNVGEIKCRIEPAGATAQVTAVDIVNENGVPRITRVEIKGEDDWHVF